MDDNNPVDNFDDLNYEKVSFAMKQLKKMRDKKKNIIDNYKKELDAIIEWKDKELHKLEFLTDRYTEVITRYAEFERQATGEKSLSTPWGSYRYRKMPDSWAWPDDDRMVEILKDIPDSLTDGLIKIKYTYDKKVLKKRFKTSESGEVYDSVTGDIVNDIQVVKQPDSFSIITENKDEDEIQI